MQGALTDSGQTQLKVLLATNQGYTEHAYSACYSNNVCYNR